MRARGKPRTGIPKIFPYGWRRIRSASAAATRFRIALEGTNGYVPTAVFWYRLGGCSDRARPAGRREQEDLMPIVTIVLREGRTVEQKREMVKAVTEAIVRTTNAKPEAVHIVVHDEPATNIGNGGQLLADKR